MLTNKLFALLGLCLFSIGALAQNQTVRGTITDKISQSPLPGAQIIVLETDPVIQATTDDNGEFTLPIVPVGPHTFRVTYFGYDEIMLQNIQVNSGKETVLNIGMEETVDDLEEVVVTAKTDKNKPLNEMSTVSTRTFSVEETQRFAAAVNDPGRMASSFAGVVSAGDGNNTISIRGNSPNGLLWRMEGVEIPNPNHFANAGTSGGGISILSAQLMGNSDFSTGAFASEYGNALSGVFDLRLRKGNNEKREYTIQAGLLGMDVAAEGPFKKGYDGSFLINYRYSTLSLIGKLGVPLGDAVTNFQDVSYNISLPAGKIGRFTLFGFGGLSSQTHAANKDTTLWTDYYNRMNTDFYSNTGASGITHTKLFANQSYLKTAVVFSGTVTGAVEDELQYDLENNRRLYEQRFRQSKLTVSSVYTQKINARSNIRTGIIFNNLGYGLLQKSDNDTNVLLTTLDEKGNTQTIQAFFQWNYRIGDKLTTNLGMHYLHLLLNNSFSPEPRASLKYDFNDRHHLTLGYGLHGQVQPIGVYFMQRPVNGEMTRVNESLKMSKAHHVVLGYDWVLNQNEHIKTEIYLQHLFDLPVSTDPTNTYSIVNMYDGFAREALNNNGIGRNYGLELTYERFLYKGLYYLLSVSLYDAQYRASDNRWYNSTYNTNYAATLTMGKEWNLRNQEKKRMIGFNIKSVYVGGFRYTPIDLEASVAAGETVLKSAETNALKMPDYYRLDIRFSLKRNYEKITSTFAIDIQNTTNRKNVGGQYFDSHTGEVKYWYQTPLIPVVSYKLEF